MLEKLDEKMLKLRSESNMFERRYQKKILEREQLNEELLE